MKSEKPVSPDLTARLRKAFTDQGGSFSGPDEMEAFRLVTLLKGLALEASTGLKMSRHVSCYAIAKREHGLKGNKQKVFIGLAAIVKKKTGIDLTGLDVSPSVKR